MTRLNFGTLLRLAATTGAITAAATGSVSAQEEDITVGFVVAMSGMFQPYDASGTKMAQMFIDQVNNKGGLLGRKLVPVVADTKSDRVEGARAAQEVLTAGADLVIVTCDYDFGAPAALEAQKAGVMVVSLCAGDAKMGPIGVGPLAFSANRAGPLDGASLAYWAYNTRGFRNAYMITDQTIEYSKSQCAGFEWAWSQMGGTLVGSDTFSAADATIASQVTALADAAKDGGVDAVMLCTFLPGGASALRQIRSAGIEVPIMSGEAMAGTFWTEAVPDLSNFYTTQYAGVSNDPRPEVKAILDAYAAFNGEPLVEPSAFPIHAWLELWTRAVETAGTTDSMAVLDVMNGYADEPTTFGPYTFTPDLHIQDRAQIVVIGVQKGQADSFEIVPPEIEVPTEVLYRQAQ